MKTSEKGIALIKKFESCRLKAYQCSAGVWTIGYGHTAGVHKGMTISQAKAEAYLRQDVVRFEKAVNGLKWDWMQGQFDALVSFAFNCGEGNLRLLCKGRTLAEIADAMLLYNKAGGKVNAGLTARRKAERELFLSDMEVTHDMNTLRKGDKGQQVMVLQILLDGGLAVDGIFGNATLAAVESYQERCGLDSDGIVGANTWEKLLEWNIGEKQPI